MATAAEKLERKRLREVSRYYCATNYPVDNTFNGSAAAGSSCDGGLDLFPTSDGPLRPARHSPDPALTAFSQLAAHKLNAQRAFISIIDHKTHHIIAEATKTISLQSEDQHAEGDQLYCGLQALPIDWGICPSTIHVFSDPDSEHAISTANITANTSRYIIRDLALEETYRDRPYIQHWPYMRFYAEVPLISPAGFVIGSLSIVDDRPRQIFTDADVATLQEIATVITLHLEVVRLQHDSKHAGRLMQGLSSFVKDESRAKCCASGLAATSSCEESLPTRSRPCRTCTASKGCGSQQGPGTVFSRASTLIRKSMDLEGVVFYDARNSVTSPLSKQSVCENLGSSTKPESATREPLDMPQELLLQISARYSTGKIFNFDELGLVTADHEEGSSTPTANKTRPETDAALLSATFPGAHSIIFFPLPAAEDRWYAGCFGWTFNAKRALQSEEITYFAAFSNTIMSEIFRLEAVAMDRAKSDFISSISHELRSPLHGVLASAELLQASSSGPDQDSLIHMVDTCGRTLLDTMNHLFDYAKITNTARSGPTEDSSSPMSAQSTLDLSELVEEVVEAVYTGHQFAPASIIASRKVNGAPKSSRLVSVILDINGARDWVFKSEAGAWRRIVMNLFGNALKYTESGAIRISLRASRYEPEPEGPSSTMVEFRVTDTGKGISKDYLRNRLYTPFTQEDSLSVGTGLGLSIVRQIVTTLGGKMDIQSKLGEGTTVTVLIPLAAPSTADDLPNVATRELTRALRARKITYAILAFDGLPTGSNESLMRCVIHCLADWFGLERVDFSSAIVPDLVIAEYQTMQNLLGLLESGSPCPGRQLELKVKAAEEMLSQHTTVPLLVFGASSSAQPLPIVARHRRLVQPFGPHKLASAITASLSVGDMAGGPPKTNGESRPKRSLKRSYSAMSGSFSPYKIVGNPGSFMPGESNPESRSAALPVVDRSALSLLLVDDNVINLKIICTYLQKLSCRYTTASNGLEAVETYQSAYQNGTPFDAVLMDISMPVMDGFEATREIRSFERTSRIANPSRIIALTGLTCGKSQEEALASGADLFLTKPVPLKKLKVTLGLTDACGGEDHAFSVRANGQ